ncbi:transmembrane anchor protein [Litorimonas sp.]|uniref:transmembrane anchor protein n=1 Tax=Litorimonas sp. TaxID=1892381 RepID=UPI003A88F1CE
MYNEDMPRRADLPSTKKLMQSTFIAVASATAILVTIVLPAEYAYDPTGVGNVLGLTQMGEIKQQLALEAEADQVATVEVQSKTQSSNLIIRDSTADTELSTVRKTVQEGNKTASSESRAWRDEMSLTMAPGEAAEVKLVMQKGETAFYSWSVDQGHLNSDLHTDDVDGEAYSYDQGRALPEKSGKFTAVSDGAHGWYWRNRSSEVVTVTIGTRGAYSEMKQMM